jgi:hypothetical protein
VDYSVSDDAKAFEIRFRTALAAGVGSPSFDGVAQSKAPIGTRGFAAVVPAARDNVKASITLDGFFVAQPGTSVTVVVANDSTASPTSRTQEGSGIHCIGAGARQGVERSQVDGGCRGPARR